MFDARTVIHSIVRQSTQKQRKEILEVIRKDFSAGSTISDEHIRVILNLYSQDSRTFIRALANSRVGSIPIDARA